MWKPMAGFALVAAVLGAAWAAETPEQAALTRSMPVAGEPYTITRIMPGNVDAAVDPAMRKAVAALLADLAADEFSVRDAAQKKLLALGSGARSAMVEKCGAAKAAEVRGRLQEAIDAIDEREALNLPPVSLSLDTASEGEFVDALGKALGVMIECRGDDSLAPSISLDERDQPFWELIRKVNRDHTLYVGSEGNIGRARVTFQPRDEMERACVIGPFLFTPWAFRHSRSIEYGEQDEQKSKVNATTFHMDITADPRLLVLGMSEPMLTEFSDNAGNDLLTDASKNLDITSDWNRRGIMTMDLVLPERPGTRAHVKGHVKFLIAVGTEVVDIPDVSAVVREPIAVGGFEFAVQRMELLQTRLDVQYKLDAVADIGPIVRPKFSRGELYMHDGDGKLLWGGLISTGSYVKREHGAVKEPISAKLIVPARTTVVDVPFEFKDLPMP